ncbi:TlpA family protein disulfide reductase [Exilibacterium tricleocarpae]|uniref:TlpA family protein disulfide reductase n=1 Tax=Exilibacterium tricleocarpae TaxID=2591008 RepID=A0A545U9M7_9GAMM|nr:TlpA disulfide reductase family protein [Exilibacterium tricleocarpae]TQV86175.1 TlpA family protein disulfide reductase [Exilibacterium tricleocarpae]
MIRYGVWIAACLFCVMGCEPTEEDKLVVATTAGVPAPAFRLRDLAGNPVALADSHGAVRVINFWATWCAPCRVEMPTLEALQEQFAPEQVLVLAVSVDENPAEVASYIAAERYTFSVLLDNHRQAAPRYGANMYPFSVIVDKRGRMIDKIAGITDWSSADKVAYLRQLAEQPVE